MSKKKFSETINLANATAEFMAQTPSRNEFLTLAERITELGEDLSRMSLLVAFLFDHSEFTSEELQKYCEDQIAKQQAATQPGEVKSSLIVEG